MSKKSKFAVSIICAFFGLMIAIQFQSVQKPKERDTRDMWEVRAQLQEEQKTQQKLYQQLKELEAVTKQYQENTERQQIETLQKSIDSLKEKAGLTRKTTSGVILTIKPIFRGSTEQEYPSVTSELLNRLINELNTYGATDIAIENQRVISITSIRNVNGETYVNNLRLPDLPIEIKIMADDPNRLIDHMEVSQSKDDFAIENMLLDTSYQEEITLPAYQGNINLDIVEVNETQETGDE
ncbi:UPF0749 protein YlxX [Paraliobacillus quinghaiensis]|uniref:UPF0749 protein YlxX n=1 Tax=Paraliobacillus quinghaiensis TaxID=470815 RepID=A0A917TFD9_9BACI|nr:DUF881 domain-containing protein [Paraliobacillus quinghaiensis]GGM20640.1 UPF0749 protein YlxX [Paraliobacillus quinghaiensis]